MVTRVLASSCAVLTAFRCWSASGHLDLYWIDSEGGGSTLIVTSAGESVLIDSGNAGVRDPHRIQHVAADVAHLDHLDHYITTHFHSDHMGGAPELSQLIPIQNLWDNGLPDGDPDGNVGSGWPLTSKAYRNLPVKERHKVVPGSVIPLRGDHLKLACAISRQQPWNTPAWPISKASLPAGQPPVKATDTSDNANSSAWVLIWGAFRFFDAGDLTWNTETRLVEPAVLVPEVDVFQVTHHGLDVSNNPWLLRALNPTVSVMNNGSTKGTAPEVIQTLRSLPGLKAQYQVHKNLRSNEGDNNCPDDHIANLTANCSGNYIHCDVSDEGATYKIEIPGNGAKATYTSRRK